VLRYIDRPGVVGRVGGLLGAAGVNIAAMQVARAAEGGEAVGVLTLDQAVPAPVLDELVREVGASAGRLVDLTD
jgi:D-3-phosphoglycerate dehydrogenase